MAVTPTKKALGIKRDLSQTLGAYFFPDLSMFNIGINLGAKSRPLVC